MSSQRFVTNTRFIWRGITYEVKKVLPEGKLLIEDLYTGAVSTVETAQLVNALFAGELLIQQKLADGSKKVLGLALDDYDEELVKIARFRLETIKPVLDLPPAERSKAQVKICARKAEVDVATVYRWIDCYEVSGRDLRALIPSYGERGGKGHSRLTDGLDGIIDAVIREKYLVREKTTIKDIQKEVKLRVAEENEKRAKDKPLPAPSRRTIYRRVDQLDVAERFIARRGKDAARRQLAQHSQSDRPTHLYERVEFDSTRTDFMVVDDADDLPLGRLNLTTSLCVATGYPGGYYLGFEPPSVYSLQECLFHTICPKGDVQAKYGTEHPWLTYGIPFAAAVDNGKEYLSTDFEDACELLGIQLMRMPVRTPHYKASVERFFRTVNTGLFHVVPGTTFSNPTGRGDYKSMEQACVYLSQIDKILHLFLLDIYAEEFHKGLNGIPARLWASGEQAGFSPRLPPSLEELKILLGRSETRVLHHYGVEFENLRFNHADLGPLRAKLKGEPVKLRYHPGDLSRLNVLDPFENHYIEVPALAQDYTHGLSLWKHRVILNYVKSLGQEVNIEALARAKRKIQEIIEEGKEKKRASTRARQARWQTSGKPSREVKAPTTSQALVPPKASAPTVQSLEADLLGMNRGGNWSVEVSDEEVDTHVE